MVVFVDDMYKYPIGQYRGMKMSHMMADTSEELLAMADKIGVARKWLQHAGRPDEHFDISITKRTLAVQNGAEEITIREMARMNMRKRKEFVEMNRREGIMKAAKLIAYDNGMINRIETEGVFIARVKSMLDKHTGWVEINEWLLKQSDDDLNTICCGEHNDMLALMQAAPAGTEQLLEDIFDL